jgi:pimeloyl-ACP methyl ester carboxylesterase
MPFGEQFAAVNGVRVLVPIHPGFGGTPRPDGLTGIPRLAALYLRLLEDLGLEDVTVIGNSIGGWITAEIALLRSPRVSGIVFIDAVGLEVPGPPGPGLLRHDHGRGVTRTFHDPAPFRFDPTTLPPEAQAVAAGNRAALAAYAGASMSDPTLAGRLAHLEIPTLVLWGESDRIADPDYGRA